MREKSIEKLKILCDHWIKHNEEHAKEFLEWGEAFGGKIEELLREAKELFLKANSFIERVKEEIGERGGG